MDALSWTLRVSAVCGVGLNLASSSIVGLRYAKWNKPTTWRARHAAGYALLFVLLNLLLLPAGLALGGWIGRLIK
jgi:hypothetical protein